MEHDETRNPAENAQMQAPAEPPIEQSTVAGECESPVVGGPSIGQTRHVKPMLTVEQQIAHLKEKGVTFDLCSEDEASRRLSNTTYYFKLAAYRVLFQKRVGGERDGQYVGLDFGNLLQLAAVDQSLRYTVLPMTLDVEHAARAKLMNRLGSVPNEDGYGIVADYMASLNHDNRRRRQAEINMLEPDAYCGDLVRKYRDDMPAWVFLELVSFGSFIDFYLFCSQRWDDAAMNEEHYMLRAVKSARNAAAHSSNVVNGFGDKTGATFATSASVSQALSAAGISRRVRTSKMANPRLQQIATLLYLHSRTVTDGAACTRASRELAALAAEMASIVASLPDNDAISSSFGFLVALFDKWFQSPIME